MKNPLARIARLITPLIPLLIALTTPGNALAQTESANLAFIAEEKWTSHTWQSAANLLVDPDASFEVKKRTLDAIVRFKHSNWPPSFQAAFRAFLPTADVYLAEQEKRRRDTFRDWHMRAFRAAVFSQAEWSSEMWEQLANLRFDQLPRYNENVFYNSSLTRMIFLHLTYSPSLAEWALPVQKFLIEHAPSTPPPGTDGFLKLLDDTSLEKIKMRDFNAEAIWRVIRSDLATDNFASLAPHLTLWRNLPDVIAKEIVERFSDPLNPRNTSLVKLAYHFIPILSEEQILRTFETVLTYFLDRGDLRNLAELLRDPAAREITSLQWAIVDKIARHQGYGLHGIKKLPEGLLLKLDQLDRVWNHGMSDAEAKEKSALILEGTKTGVAPVRIANALTGLLQRQSKMRPIMKCEPLFTSEASSPVELQSLAIQSR